MHVRERPHSTGFGFGPHLGGGAHGHGTGGSVGLASALPGGQVAPPPAPPEPLPTAGSQGSQPGWLQRQFSGGAVGAAPGSQEARGAGEAFAIAAAGHQPHQQAQQPQPQAGQQEEGCAELLERCRQQLLAESRR